MVFPDRSTRAARRQGFARQGEVALTLTVISLVLMAMGTLLGVTRTQDVRSRAADDGKIQCGQTTCRNNSQCSQSAGFLVLCHLSSGQCRPASSRDVCPGGGTARADTRKKDGGETCDPHKDECKTGFYCGSNGLSYQCQANLVGGGTPSGGGGSNPPLATPTPGAVPIGTAFLQTSLPCKIDFTFQWDPEIEYIRISKLDGSQTYDFTNNNVRRIVPANESGPIGWEFAFPRGRSAGIAVSFTFDINDVFIHITDGPRNVSYYFQRPDWLNGGEGYNIDIGYKYVIGGVDKHAHQIGTSKACTSNTPVIPQSPTPIFESSCSSPCTLDSQCPKTPYRLVCRRKLDARPTDFSTYCLLPTSDAPDCRPVTSTPPTGTPPVSTSTPTPRLSSCNHECTSNAQCPSTAQYPLVCRQRMKALPLEPKYCLLPANDSPDCRTPATPTVTMTPTATPTPPVCKKSVYFMIDSSSTQGLTVGDIQSGLNNYFNSRGGNAQLSYSYDTFNITAPVQSGSGDHTIKFTIDNGGNWTNINKAFEVLGRNGSDLKIFISDGIPSVSDADFNGNGDIDVVRVNTPISSFQREACTYSAGGTTLSGCDPVARTPGRTDNDHNISQCKGLYKDAFTSLCKNSYQLGTSNADYVVGVNGGEGINEANLRKALLPSNDKDKYPIDRYFPGINSFTSNLTTILDKLCETGTGGNKPFGGTRSFMSSFSVKNQSTTKSVQSVNVKTCNQAGGSCQSFLNTLGVQPQSTGYFSQVIPESVPVANRALVTCDVNYTDGSSLPCPKKQTQNDSVQFNLTVDNKNVSGSTKTFSQAADINNDGTVNAIDYVRFLSCFKQQSTGGPVSSSYDIVSDGLCNAQDISVIIERLGQRAK